MNQNDMQELVANCTLLGLSPFRVAGIEEGTVLLLRNFNHQVRFVREHPSSPYMGIFQLVDAKDPTTEYRFNFCSVILKDFNESNSTGSN